MKRAGEFLRNGRCVRATVALVVSGILAACGRTPPEPARSRVVSPEQARMDAVLRQNDGRPSEPDLADAYAVTNAQYFDNQLPPVRIRWEPGLDSIGGLIAENFRLEGLTNGELILLHPALRDDPRQQQAVLCHEMVHVELRDRADAHGPAFQARLRALAERGAFEGIVATDAERDALAASLAQTTRRLSEELSDLGDRQKRIEAEAPSLTREILQDRIWEFNQRVRTHNEDVDAFNREVERYNLMVTYPDGLDRERLKGRAPITPAGG